VPRGGRHEWRGEKGGCFQPFIGGFLDLVAVSDFICGCGGLMFDYHLRLPRFGFSSEAAIWDAVSEVWVRLRRLGWGWDIDS